MSDPPASEDVDMSAPTGADLEFARSQLQSQSDSQEVALPDASQNTDSQSPHHSQFSATQVTPRVERTRGREESGNSGEMEVEEEEREEIRLEEWWTEGNWQDAFLDDIVDIARTGKLDINDWPEIRHILHLRLKLNISHHLSHPPPRTARSPSPSPSISNQLGPSQSLTSIDSFAADDDGMHVPGTGEPLRLSVQAVENLQRGRGPGFGGMGGRGMRGVDLTPSTNGGLVLPPFGPLPSRRRRFSSTTPMVGGIGLGMQGQQPSIGGTATARRTPLTTMPGFELPVASSSSSSSSTTNASDTASIKSESSVTSRASSSSSRGMGTWGLGEGALESEEDAGLIGGKVLPGSVEEEEARGMVEGTLRMLEGFEDAPPFTIQRLCELISRPLDHYKNIGKYLRAIERNLLVTTFYEPQSAASKIDPNDPTTIAPGTENPNVPAGLALERPLFSPIPFLVRKEKEEEGAGGVGVRGEGDGDVEMKDVAGGSGSGREDIDLGIAAVRPKTSSTGSPTMGSPTSPVTPTDGDVEMTNVSGSSNGVLAPASPTKKGKEVAGKIGSRPNPLALAPSGVALADYNAHHLPPSPSTQDLATLAAANSSSTSPPTTSTSRAPPSTLNAANNIEPFNGRVDELDAGPLLPLTPRPDDPHQLIGEKGEPGSGLVAHGLSDKPQAISSTTDLSVDVHASGSGSGDASGSNGAYRDNAGRHAGESESESEAEADPNRSSSPTDSLRSDTSEASTASTRRRISGLPRTTSHQSLKDRFVSSGKEVLDPAKEEDQRLGEGYTGTGGHLHRVNGAEEGKGKGKGKEVPVASGSAGIGSGHGIKVKKDEEKAGGRSKARKIG